MTICKHREVLIDFDTTKALGDYHVATESSLVLGCFLLGKLDGRAVKSDPYHSCYSKEYYWQAPVNMSKLAYRSYVLSHRKPEGKKDHCRWPWSTRDTTRKVMECSGTALLFLPPTCNCPLNTTTCTGCFRRWALKPTSMLTQRD